MTRSQLSVLWVIVLFAFAACDTNNLERGSDAQDELAVALRAMNKQAREALQKNDYAKADSLTALVMEEASNVGNYEALIDASLYRVSSYQDRRRIREGEKKLQATMDLIEEHGSPQQKVQALIRQSNFSFMDGRPDEGSYLLEKANELIAQVEDARTIGSLYASRARAISETNPVEAIRLYYEALEKLEESGELSNKAVVRNNIGLLLHNQEDYDLALEEYRRSLRINRQIGNRLQSATNYNNMANTLSSLGMKEAAADTLLKAVMINQQMGISPSLIQNYFNLAQVYMDTDRLSLAYSFFEQGYEESMSINFMPGVMYHSAGLADVLFKKERYDEVPQYIEISSNLAGQTNNLNVLARTWNTKALLNEQLGNYPEALAAIREERKYVDQIDSIRRHTEFEEVRSRLELELKTTENELLRQQLSYRERLGRNQQLILFSLFLGVLITGTLLVILFRNKNKLETANQFLKQKNEVITAKNTQLSDLNAELKHLNDEKTRLVGMIIHDLRNPLFAVIGFLELIDESLRDESEKEHLALAMNSANRLNQLISSLLEVHSLEKETKELKLEYMSVSEVLEHALVNFKEIARKKNIHIEKDISDISAYSEPAYLSRIADNIISNAIKYSPRHSRVRVEVLGKKETWEFSVQDEGPGFSKEDQQNLYQMFGKLSAKPTGGEESTGLGLYTVKMLVGRLGGRIHLESKIGKGSRFICEFPVKPDPDAGPGILRQKNGMEEPSLQPESMA